MIVAGIGAHRGVAVEAVLATLDAALARIGLTRPDVGLLASPAVKGGEPGISAAALALDLPLVLVPQNQLDSAVARLRAISDQPVARLRNPSGAEAAALATAGPDAGLLGPPLTSGSVTCAIARRAGAL